MWWTHDGMRILEDAEGRLFREGLAELYDELLPAEHEDDLPDTGLALFDRLTSAQKFAMLDLVGRGLLRRSVRVTHLTAVLEATVAAIYLTIEDRLHVELVEPGRGQYWRALIGAAYRERCPDRPPSQHCKDFDRWQWCVDALLDQILWDRDHEMADTLSDIPWEACRLIKDEFGIADDYYAAVAPDPSPRELAGIHRRLRRLCDENRSESPSQGGIPAIW